MMTKGKYAEQAVELWAKGERPSDCFLYRIEDHKDANFGRGKTRKVIASAKPSDYLLTQYGTTHYLEVKESHEKVSFPFSNIKREQWRCAKRVTKAGGSYIFLLYSFERKMWYRVPAQVLLGHDAKSIRWVVLDAHLHVTQSPRLFELFIP